MDLSPSSRHLSDHRIHMVLYRLTMRCESTRVLAIHTVALGRVLGINDTYGFAFVGCVDSKGTLRGLTLCVATTPITRRIGVNAHIRIVC